MMRTVVAAALVGLAASGGRASDPVPVSGSSTKYPQAVSVTVDGKPVSVKLTGVGLRTKASLFNVYAIGSYLQDGVAARTAEELAAADGVKMLYLVMERSVSGPDLVDAFKTAIAKSHSADRFATEYSQLMTAINGRSAEKGDHVSLVSVPGVGLRVNLVGKAEVTVASPAFARAVWDIYLGPKPLQDDIKAGLVKRLPR